MKLPTTRQECVKLYDLHRRRDLPMTKFDMYIGGMICCNEKEFSYRKPMTGGWIISGVSPCLCVYEKRCKTDGAIGCVEATEETLLLPWDAPLYEGVRHE